MATHARLTSVDALDAFRSSLIVFLNKAHSALDQSSDEIRRVRSWIQHDQRTFWEAEVRRRARALAQTEQELLSARMTKALDNLSAQQLAVNKARHALEEASGKLRKVKLWMRDFDGTVEPLSKALNSLRGYLDHDMPHAIGYLTEVQKIMASYMESPQRPATSSAPRSDTPIPAEETPAQPL